MTVSNGHILLVESDPDVIDLIARQMLQPLGYQVSVVGDVTSAIQQVTQSTPDLIISKLNLPGLSGKDLLVALNSQGINTPLIVIAEKGQEHGVLQAFRLGAIDYLIQPARETEVVSAIERALRQTRDTRTRQQLDQRVKEANQELQHRVHELTSILGMGNAVASITDQRFLFDMIIEGAVQVAQADIGCLLLRDDTNKTFLLSAHRGLPDVWVEKMNQPFDDGVSALTALSGEKIFFHGEPLKRFKIAALGKSVAVMPFKVHQDVIGILIVVRKEEKPFEHIEQTLLEAVADYASVSLVNARLFSTLEHAAETARSGEKRQNALLQSLQDSLQSELNIAVDSIDLLLTDKMGPLSPAQEKSLHTARAALQRLSRAAEETISPIVSSPQAQ